MNIPEKAPWEMTREEINHVFLRLAENIQHCDMMYRGSLPVLPKSPEKMRRKKR